MKGMDRDFMKKKRKKNREWVWETLEIVELLGGIILWIPRAIIRIWN